MIIHVDLFMVLAVVITTVTAKHIMAVTITGMVITVSATAADDAVAPKTFLKLS